MSKTYISLFSSAGVGCYGFKLEGFECIATNELIERRLNIQKINNKCKYDSGYICGDITKTEIKDLLFNELEMWKKKEHLKDVDCLIATPPCQGMSLINHKKNDNEIVRNSLVVESIKIVLKIMPKIFVFENVPMFLKTCCTDVDGKDKTIKDAINFNLGKYYSIHGEVLNFKNYGSNSSRTRTLVIGVRNDLLESISPLDLFPDYVEEKKLYDIIGNMKSLTDFYEFDSYDIYHFFRGYSEHMRPWISNTPEGGSAFDNPKPEHRPHQIVNGEYVPNVRKNADKYTRQRWDKVAPCIHTRNDQLASQNTIHPVDDRVFSIRELMIMMTIPFEFKWSNIPFEELNKLSLKDKIKFMKKEEINIRQTIGEAVPTSIFNAIAKKINYHLKEKNFNNINAQKIVDEYQLYNKDNLINFIKDNLYNYDLYLLMRIAELANSKRLENSAYYTNKSLLNIIESSLPQIDKDEIHILEPSVGVGNFIPIILKKYESKQKIVIDVVDVDEYSLEILKVLTKKYIKDNVTINFINNDFILLKTDKKYDLAIGNPPFSKISKRLYKNCEHVYNHESTNMSSYFLEKCLSISDNVCMIMPKNILNTPEYFDTRKFVSNFAITNLIDFGEKGFKGVLVETVCLIISKNKPNNTNVINVTENSESIVKQNYITSDKLPYWIIYRNSFFDSFFDNMIFDIFSVFRDRQITNKLLEENGDIRVYKSRNISDSGDELLDIIDYDAYMSKSVAETLAVYKYYADDSVYLTPNMTYKTRVCKKPKNCIVNGSIAILVLKSNIVLDDEDLNFFSTEEYRTFMTIARNKQTRTLNVDSNSVYFYGVRRK